MSLKLQEILLPSAHFNGESTLPSIYEMSNVQGLTRSSLDEDDGLFVGYGFLPSLFPYRMQDLYDRADALTPYLGVILENKYLKAVFIPALGGRLWSLYDKEAGRDLLYTNPMVRPCNLAVRNAWLAGGIEFNCGMVGHHPFTCSQLFAQETHLDDGTPVLRMYEFERIRRCVYQMDFFLPEDSRLLFGRMRIVNPNRVSVPMYWWTNMAVREDKAARNVIDATVTYNNRGGVVGKNPVPIHEGIDITYPTNNPVAIDYFWKIPDASRKYTAHLGADGYGFFQTSTSRLQGRKLFVWGQGEGGSRWQEFLTADGENGRYVEIQAGLAHTQYECLPMPPLTAWEWLEGYGAMTADPAKVHGDWAEARQEVQARLDHLITAEKMESMLTETKPMALRPADRTVCFGSGWGRLENLRREKAGEPLLCPHLDFGSIGDEQAPWLRLLEDGALPGDHSDKPPVSWMLQDEWTSLLEASPDSHEKYLHLSAIYLASRRVREGAEAIEKALSFRTTSTALFIRSQVERLRGDGRTAAQTALSAVRLLPEDVSLTRQAFSMALGGGLYQDILDAYASAPDPVRRDGRVSLYYAFALLRSGQVDEAEAVLLRDGGLSVTDIREGEISLTNLYIEIARHRAESSGVPFEPDAVEVPRQFDFRMNVPGKRTQK